MLSYQHIYHAGNFADVHKHGVLADILRTLRLKPGRLSVVDTHAGRGIYKLDSEEALKSRAFDSGIANLWPVPADAGPLAAYLDVVMRHNPEGTLAAYPGSAVIAQSLLAATDQITCIERHPAEMQQLATALDGKANVNLVEDDFTRILMKHLPAPGKRGLAVIDPSYEMKSEYDTLAPLLRKAYKAWPQGCYFIWYPLMKTKNHLRMLTALRKTDIRNTLISEIHLKTAPHETFSMYGSGLAIINPPWPEAALKNLTSFIASRLAVEATGHTSWLDNAPLEHGDGQVSL